MQRTISAAKERASAPNPADTESTKESTHAGQIWKVRVFVDELTTANKNKNNTVG
jgi:hypothetical protein